MKGTRREKKRASEEIGSDRIGVRVVLCVAGMGKVRMWMWMDVGETGGGG